MPALPAPKGIQVITPDGDVVALAPESARNVLSENMGYLPATPANLAHLKVHKENSGVGAGLLANIESFGGGLTSGLTDLAEVRSGITTPEAMAARREAFPSSTAVSHMVGSGIPLALAGAAGTAAAVAAAPVALGGAALAGVGMLGGMAAAGAAGAAGGATEELSHQALGPAPLVGEQVAQQALWGGINGAVSVPLGKLGGAILGKLFKGAAGLAGFAERQAVRATGGTGAQIGKLAERGTTEAVGRNILDRGYLGKGFTDLGNDATTARAAALADMGTSGRAIEATLASTTAQVPTVSLGAELRALAQPGKMDLVAKPWKDSLGKAADLLEQYGSGAQRELPVSELQAVKAEIDGLIHSAGRQIPRELATARRLVASAMEQALPAQEQAQYMAAKQQYGLAKDAARLLGSAANKEAAGTNSGVLSALRDPMAAVSGVAAGAPGAGAYLAAKFAGRAARGGNIARAADYLSTTRWVQGLAKGATGQWDAAIERVLQGTAATVGHEILGVDRYDDIAHGVESAAQDPQALTGAIHAALGADMADHHPEITTTASLTMQQAFKYLDDKRPRARFTPAPYDDGYTPPDYLKAKWLDMVRGVTNPASVASNPSADSLAAVQAVYPQSYQALVSRLQDRLAAHGSALPYQSKVAASKFLGMPLSSLTDVALAQRMQSLYAAADPAAQAPPGQSGSARNSAARTMHIKQIAQDDATSVDHMLQHATGSG